MNETRREREKRIRTKIREPMARRVYVLPSRIIDGILDYQETELLPTEVAAVRALLDIGLKGRGF
jgi:hypothetical protein